MKISVNQLDNKGAEVKINRISPELMAIKIEMNQLFKYLDGFKVNK